MGGGGGSKTTNTIQDTTKLLDQLTIGLQKYQANPFVQAGAENAIMNAQALLMKGYEVPEQKIAQLSQLQKDAIKGTKAAQGIGQDLLDKGVKSLGRAEAFSNQGNKYAGESADYARKAAELDPLRVDKYLNPYSKFALEALNQDLGSAAAQRAGTYNTQMGGMGGDRAAVAEAQNLQQDQLARGRLMGEFWQNAAQIAQQQQGAKQGAYAQGSQLLGNLGSQSAQMAALRAGIGQQYMGAGAQKQAMTAQDLAQLYQAGLYRQQQQQRGMDAGYQARLANIEAPWKAAQFYNQTIQGMAPALGGSQLSMAKSSAYEEGHSEGQSTTTTSGGSPFAQIAGLGLSFLGGLSDERAKEGKEKVGELYDGQPVYRYRYKTEMGDIPDRTHIGLMAQDVEKKNPFAVMEINGIKGVDYHEATEEAAKKAKKVSHKQSGGETEDESPLPGIWALDPTTSALPSTPAPEGWDSSLKVAVSPEDNPFRLAPEAFSPKPIMPGKFELPGAPAGAPAPERDPVKILRDRLAERALKELDEPDKPDPYLEKMRQMEVPKPPTYKTLEQIQANKSPRDWQKFMFHAGLAILAHSADTDSNGIPISGLAAIGRGALDALKQESGDIKSDRDALRLANDALNDQYRNQITNFKAQLDYINSMRGSARDRQKLLYDTIQKMTATASLDQYRIMQEDRRGRAEERRRYKDEMTALHQKNMDAEARARTNRLQDELEWRKTRGQFITPTDALKFGIRKYGIVQGNILAPADQRAKSPEDFAQEYLLKYGADAVKPGATPATPAAPATPVAPDPAGAAGALREKAPPELKARIKAARDAGVDMNTALLNELSKWKLQGNPLPSELEAVLEQLKKLSGRP